MDEPRYHLGSVVHAKGETLEDFDGPLDVILLLLSKNKIEIQDIQISAILEQYLAYLDEMKRMDMEIASEFIAMAARLVQMKSYLLLPRSEEGERMKEELTGELIEYEACRQMARQLTRMGEGVYHAVRRPMLLPEDRLYSLRHSPRVLVEALEALQGRKARRRPPDPERFEPLVTAPFVSVASRVVHVLRGLVTGRVRRLSQLFRRGEGRSQTVATFLAVLELVRAGRLSLGDGPVDAAFLAIESILGRHYELDDFQIQAVTEGREAMGESVVKLRSGGKLYSGRGISTDIIGASVHAYLNAINKIVYEEAANA